MVKKHLHFRSNPTWPTVPEWTYTNHSKSATDRSLWLKSKKLTTRFHRATACNTTHGIAKAFLSVRPSVKRVDCDKTKETCAHILIPHERSFIQVF